MRFFSMLLIAVFVVCLATAAFAETQSVKVSGDLTMRSLYRHAYNYNTHPPENGGETGVNDNATWSWIMSVAEVQVDAQLTDNVQTVVRILNQRDWNVRAKNVGQNTNLQPLGQGGYTVDPGDMAVNLDLAYVALKSFIYEPLTITLGRQDLWFGKGFIVGLNQKNIAQIGGPVMGLQAPEYTAINSFDAAKVVLDFDPILLSGIYSKVWEGSVQDDDDTDLYGINIGYKFDLFKAETEGYWFYKRDNMIVTQSQMEHNRNNDIHTLGMRGSLDPVDTVTIFGEGAYQLGSYVGSRAQFHERNRSAYALDFGGECRYLMDKVMWKPKMGVEYILYSGTPEYDNELQTTSSYQAWDPIYRGKFDSAIREFVGKYYSSAQYQPQPDRIFSSDASFQNQHQVVFRGEISPMDTLLCKANYNLFWTQYPFQPERVPLDKGNDTVGFIGQEVDLEFIWDYTEDVSFGLLSGWFMPNEVYTNDSSKTATDIVGTVKVSF